MGTGDSLEYDLDHPQQQEEGVSHTFHVGGRSRARELSSPRFACGAKFKQLNPEKDRERGRWRKTHCKLTKCAAREHFLRQLTDSNSNKNCTNLTGFATMTTTTTTMTTKTEAKPGQQLRLCLRLCLRLATTHLVSLHGAPRPSDLDPHTNPNPSLRARRHLQHGCTPVG